jgi:hypothetical protein
MMPYLHVKPEEAMRHECRGVSKKTAGKANNGSEISEAAEEWDMPVLMMIGRWIGF